MDIKAKIEEIVKKLMSDKTLMARFEKNPASVIEQLIGIDLPDEQINQVIEGVKGKIDLSNFDLSKLDVKEAAGLLGKLKGILGK